MKVRRKGNTVKWGADKWEGKKFPGAVLAFVPEGAGGGRGYDIQKGDWWILLTTNSMVRPRLRLIWPNLLLLLKWAAFQLAPSRERYSVWPLTVHCCTLARALPRQLQVCIRGPQQPPPLALPTHNTSSLQLCWESQKKRKRKKKLFTQFV